MNRRVRNAVGSLLLALALAASQIPAADVEATTSIPSDFQISGDTLVKYTGTATSVSVPDSVKVIGREAFQNDSDLYAVYLPEGLTAIESGAFSNCTALSVADLPSGLERIGNFAFSNCAVLKEAEFGKELTKLGYGVYAGCDSLSDIKVDPDNGKFVCEAGVLYDKDKTKIYQALSGSAFTKCTMPETVKTIEPYSFWGCPDLRFIGFSGKLEAIPAYSFSNCKGLEEITIPYSVHRIDVKAFADCTNLEKAEIPPSVSVIHETAFDGCPKLKITAEEGSAAAEFDQNRDTGAVANAEHEDTADRENEQSVSGNEAGAVREEASGAPDQDTPESTDTAAQGQTAPSGLLGETRVVAGSAVVFIDNSLERVHGTGSLDAPEEALTPQQLWSGQAQSVSGEDSVSGNGPENAGTDEKGGQFPKYTVVGDRIAGQAYYMDEQLTDYTVPAGITKIGSFAFARSGLKSITIPEGVTEIGYGAFYHCDHLQTVKLPASVKEIGPAAFDKTGWLENWKNGGSTDDYYIAGDGILLAYKGQDSRLTVPEGVKRIAPGVFKDHKGVTEVSLPNSLEVIGEEAFAGCSNLTRMVGGVGIREIRDRAFQGCPIDTVRIPETVEKIGLGAFDQSGAANVTAVNAAVFMGKTLPKAGFSEDAVRLTNTAARSLALKGVEAAVVSAGMTDFKGTVLDEQACGFRGVICSMEQESEGGAAGKLHIIKCTVQPDENGGFRLPETVMIYGKPYAFTNAGEFTSTDAAPEQTEAGSPETAVRIVNSSSLFQNSDAASAVLANHRERYHLTITDSAEAQDAVYSAFSVLYGEDNGQKIDCFDLSLYDAGTGVPIKKLGTERMTVTLPLPADMTEGSLHVVCTDDDGQLEEAEHRLVEVNGTLCVEFKAKHFSPYGIYSYGEGGGLALARNGGDLTSLTRKKDASPDTGDLLHPKWFLTAGLFALSMMFFFMKRTDARN